MEADANAAKTGPKSRILILLTALNLLLLGSFLYSNFLGGFKSGGGVAIVLYNNTRTPMIDMTLEHPGGQVGVPKLGPSAHAALSFVATGPFDGTLSFKDDQGNAHQEKLNVHPYHDLLIMVTVEPVLEESVVKTAEGKEEKVLKASPTKVRVASAYLRPKNE